MSNSSLRPSAESSASTSSQQGAPWLVRAMAGHPRESAWTLYGAGILLAAVTLLLVPLVFHVKIEAEYLLLCIWACALALTAWGAATWQLLRPDEYFGVDHSRVLLLIVGGLTGLFTTILGFALGWAWWDTFASWVNGEAENTWRIFAVVIAVVGGLAIMFASLQQGRSQERTNPTLRVMLYGYNAVLMGVLLLAILIVANVLVYLKFPHYADFTSGTLYSLSPRSKSTLQALEQPTTVYAIFSTHSHVGAEVKSLLTQCREVNDKIQVRYLSPDDDALQVLDLARKFGFSERNGILVTYGTDAQMEHRFIKPDNIISFDFDQMGARPNPDEKRGAKFKGEDALITELTSLEAGNTKQVIYFTQGSGELDLKKMDMSRVNEGLGVFKDRLEKRGMQVKPLIFKPDSPIPDEATVVVIAGAGNPMPDYALKGLRDYMNPANPKKTKGKLFVLAGVDSTRDGKMKQTGLEGLLAEFDVQLGNERILSVPTQYTNHPLMCLIGANGDLASKNAIAAAFKDQGLRLTNVRPVRPLPQAGAPRGPANYSADALFETLSPTWAESNLRDDPVQILRDLVKDRKQLAQKLSYEPQSVAVAVTEAAPFNPADPHAAMRTPDGKPRLVVFGNSNIASNQMVGDRTASVAFDLLASCIDWLRDKPASIGIEPKKRDFYVLDPTASFWRIVALPGMIAGIAVIGLGTGVWVVRRR